MLKHIFIRFFAVVLTSMIAIPSMAEQASVYRSDLVFIPYADYSSGYLYAYFEPFAMQRTSVNVLAEISGWVYVKTPSDQSFWVKKAGPVEYNEREVFGSGKILTYDSSGQRTLTEKIPDVLPGSQHCFFFQGINIDTGALLTKEENVQWDVEHIACGDAKVQGCGYVNTKGEKCWSRKVLVVRFDNVEQCTEVPIVVNYVEEYDLGEYMPVYDDGELSVLTNKLVVTNTLRKVVRVVPPGWRDDLKLNYWCIQTNDSFAVAFHSEIDTAKIYYTTNGTPVCEASACIYNDPVVLAPGVRIRAKAYVESVGISEEVDFTLSQDMVLPLKQLWDLTIVDTPAGTVLDWSEWAKVAGFGEATVYRILDDETTNTTYTVCGAGVTNCFIEAKVGGVWYRSRTFSHSWCPLSVTPKNYSCLKSGGTGWFELNRADCTITLSPEMGSWAVLRREGFRFGVEVGINSEGTYRDGYVSVVCEKSVDTSNGSRIRGSTLGLKIPIVQHEDGYFPPPIETVNSEALYANKICTFWQMPSLEQYPRDVAADTYFRVWRSEGENGPKTYLGTTKSCMYEDYPPLDRETYFYWIQAVSGDMASDQTKIKGVLYPKRDFEESRMDFTTNSCLTNVSFVLDAEWYVEYSPAWAYVSPTGQVKGVAFDLFIAASSNAYSRSDYVAIAFLTEHGWAHDGLLLHQDGVWQDVSEMTVVAPDAVLAGTRTSESLKCYIRYDNGVQHEVYPWGATLNGYAGNGVRFYVENAPLGTSISEKGVLSVGSQVTDEIVVCAEYEEWGVTNTAKKSVRVIPKKSMSEAAQTSLELTCLSSVGWSQSIADKHSGDSSVACSYPSSLKSIVSRGELSFWCKLSPEFEKLSGIYGQYLAIKVNNKVVKTLSYEDAPDWTLVRIVVPDDHSTVSWEHCYVGSKEACGTAFLDEINLSPLALTGLVMNGRDTFPSLSDAISQKPTLATYTASAIYNGLSDQPISGIPFGWNVLGTGATIVGADAGSSCTLMADSVSENTMITLRASVLTNDAVFVDKQINVTYVEPEVQYAKTLDADNLVFSQRGDAGWRGILSDCRVGSSSARSVLASSTTSEIVTTVSWGGMLSFWWKCADGTIELMIDGSVVRTISGVADWQQESVSLSKGTHEISWVHRGLENAESRAWLDGVSWSPDAPVLQSISISCVKTRLDVGDAASLYCLATYDYGDRKAISPTWTVTTGSSCATLSGNLISAVAPGSTVVRAEYAEGGVVRTAEWNFEIVGNDASLATSVGCESLTIRTGGDGVWVSAGGAAQSGAIGTGCETWMETTVHGPVKLTFFWKLNTWATGDELDLYVDGVLKQKTGGTDWKQVGINLGRDRDYVIRWTYVHGGNSASTLHGGIKCVCLEGLDDPASIRNMKIEGPSVVNDEHLYDYKCYVTYDTEYCEKVTPSWSVTTGETFSRIDSKGVFGAWRAGNAKICASYELNGKTYSCSKEVVVKHTLKELIVKGESRITAGSHRRYSCAAVYNDGTTNDVDVAISIADIYRSNGTTNGFARLEADGTLYVCSNDVGSVTLSASYTELGVSVETSLKVSIGAPEDVALEIIGDSVAKYGESPTYRAHLTFGEDDLETDVPAMWAVVSGTRSASIGSSTGVLTTKTVGDVKLRAYKSVGGKLLLVYTDVTIVPSSSVRGVVQSLYIDGPTSIEYGSSAQFICYGVYENGTVARQDAVWSVKNCGNDGWVSVDGVFTSNPVENSIGSVSLGATVGNLSKWQNITLTVHYEEIPFTQALGDSLVFESSDPTNWFGQTVYSYDGTGAVRTRIGTSSKTASLWSNVDGPGTLTFRWSQKAQTVYRYVLFLVDGVQKGKLEKSSDYLWQDFLIELSEGAHELEWRYVNESGVNDKDWFVLDDVSWVKEPTFIGLSIVCADTLLAGNVTTSRCVSVFDNGSIVTNQAVQWGVTSGDGLVQFIDNAGTLLAGSNGGVATLSAACVVDGEKVSVERDVLVQKRTVALQIEGSSLLGAWNNESYACNLVYSDGSWDKVWPNWSVSSSDAEIDSWGNLTIYDGRSVTVVAKYGDGTVKLLQSNQVNVVTMPECLDSTNLQFGVFGNGAWKPDADVSHDASLALRGEPSAGMVASVSGKGTLKFWTRIADGGKGSVRLLVDDIESVALHDTGVWLQQTARIEGDGLHYLVWKFESESVDDACWLDGVLWIPDSAQIVIPSNVTGGVELKVAATWLADLECRFGSGRRSLFTSKFGGDLSTALRCKSGKKDHSGNDMYVWQDYIAGTDPTDATNTFRAKIEMVDGLPQVNWEPNLNESTEERTYKVYGRKSLSSSDGWEYPANSAVHQFFKVDVAMPNDNDGGSDAPGEIDSWLTAVIPSAVSGLIYDGTVKYGVPSGTGYNLSNATATGAGDYVASVTLASGYRWSDGSQTAQSIPWSIAKASNGWISEPTLSETSFLEGSAVTLTAGTPKFGTVSQNYTADSIKSLTAGSYTLTSTVASTANYAGLTHSIPFTVTAPDVAIALPTANSGLVYTGNAQYGVSSGIGYTITGNSAINAGSYTATATLKSGYKWSDGNTSNSRTISWSIAKATNAWLTEPSLSSTAFEEGASVTISLGSTKFGTCLANYTAADLATLTSGSYTLVVSVDDTDDFSGLTRTFEFTVAEVLDTGDPLYCVVNLSSGSSATEYPVQYLSKVPTGGWTDEFKTTKLVLRRIEPGSFKMQGITKTTITQPFYIGVFEMTQRQYELIMGTNPSQGKSFGAGDDYPVNTVSYDTLRGSVDGALWPATNSVDAASFMGVLRQRTKLIFDLPTAAQWEYAARAGTSTTYYWGSSLGVNYDGKYLWYMSNSDNVLHAVGGKIANAWGLYDTSGNVTEWCLDNDGQLSYGNDPRGPTTSGYGGCRVSRGGAYCNGISDCGFGSGGWLYGSKSNNGGANKGFRICLNVSSDD